MAMAAGRGRGRRRGRGARGGRGSPVLVREEGGDLLFLIAEGGAGRKRRRRRGPSRGGPRGVGEGEGEGAGGSCGGGAWGERLPGELLERILLLVAGSEGAVPSLCRAARVCRRWNGAASSPVLWQKVSLGYCWAPPGQRWPPAVQKRALGTVQWLAAHRLAHLRDFALCHWKNHVPFVLQEIGQCCPLLASLKLSHCRGVTAESLAVLAERCPKLESLNLQHSQVHSSAVVSFLEAAGSRIRHLWLTYSSQTSAVIALLLGGSCPELRLLEVNTDIKQLNQHFHLSIEQLQNACPHLQVLRLLNVVWSLKTSPRSAPTSQGFPELAELCLATTSYSFVNDSTLQRILWASDRLRMLDLRGCFRVTPKALSLLPCPALEQLYLGLYCSSSDIHLPLEGIHLLTQKWSHSLQELDLAGLGFCESSLEQAMAALGQERSQGGGPPLRSLNLTGTKVMLSTVRTLIASCPALVYLNLSSCRHLPRGTKKAYRGQEEIRQCLQHLLADPEEPL
ncbi:F-box/LRR-repeat protein 6 [Paroedura picta]|uniref:F-box/LRR-repeat protein 6 n=1 Tax=Paroedura picta TaxID=143630 RepID=UPI004057C8C5